MTYDTMLLALMQRDELRRREDKHRAMIRTLHRVIACLSGALVIVTVGFLIVAYC